MLSLYDADVLVHDGDNRRIPRWMYRSVVIDTIRDAVLDCVWDNTNALIISQAWEDFCEESTENN